MYCDGFFDFFFLIVIPMLGFGSLFVSVLLWRKNEYLRKALRIERNHNLDLLAETSGFGEGKR